MRNERSLAGSQKHDKEFGGLQAIGQVSFDIRKGEIFSVIGPNGAGKTTLFNLITAFLPPMRERSFFKGETISGLKPYEVARKAIARTFQLTTLFEKNTVLENLMIGQTTTRDMGILRALFGGRGKGRTEKRTIERAHEMADFIGLDREKNIPAGLLPQRAQKQLSIGLGPRLRPQTAPARRTRRRSEQWKRWRSSSTSSPGSATPA